MVFGPQKGASPSDVAVLEQGLARLAGLAGGRPEELRRRRRRRVRLRPGASGARELRPGAAQLAEIAGLPDALAGADLVITGEGKYDATSRAGKVVGHRCSDLAAEAGVPAAVVAGRARRAPVLPAVELGCARGQPVRPRPPSRALAGAGRPRSWQPRQPVGARRGRS